MNRVAFTSVLKAAGIRSGLGAVLSELDADTLRNAIEEAMRLVWNRWAWIEWTERETRYRAPEWSSATAYASGVYVFHEGIYYQSLQSVNSGRALTDAAYWRQCADILREIPFTATGKTTIDFVFEVWDSDPDIYAGASPLKYRLTKTGINLLLNTANSAFVVYHAPRFHLEGDLWQAETSYATGAQVYYVSADGSGDYYRLTGTASAGQAPGSVAGWEIIPVPDVLANYLASAAAAGWMAFNGQSDKARIEESRAGNLLDAAVDTMLDQQQIPQVRVEV